MDRPQSPTPEEMMPRPAAVFLLIPLFAVPVVFALYGYLFLSGMAGRPAMGETVKIEFEGCASARDVVGARVEEMGLGAVELAGQGDTFALTAVFPDEPEALEDIPRTLSTRGLLEIRGGGEVLITNDDVEIAAVRLDLTMTPSTLIVVTMDGAKRVARWMNSDPEGRMVYFIDGVEVYESSNHKPFSDAELEIPPNAANDRAQMALAAHWGIVIGHPLPCDLTVTSTRVVDRAPTDE